MSDTIIKPSPWPSKDQPAFAALVSLVLLCLIAFLGFKARNEMRQYKFIGVPIERDTISVSGEGKVSAIPDIATIDLGTTTEKSMVADAQKENTRIMNALIAKMSELGIDKKDVQTTNYQIYPAYDYLNGRSQLRGYSVNQNVRVKVRDLGKIGNIVSVSADLGANQVGGISFTFDDPEKLREEARLKALQNAKTKAEALARVVGINLRRIVSFQEFSNSPSPTPYLSYAKEGLGMGGGSAEPSIEAGSNEIAVTATVTYEIE